METKEINGVEHVKTLIPCPDDIKGCFVAHYRWIPLEEYKSKQAYEKLNKSSNDFNVAVHDYIEAQGLDENVRRVLKMKRMWIDVVLGG